ncbi:MAG: hypothetical protein AAB408_03030, partial [Patescibacteria group bacterium]
MLTRLRILWVIFLLASLIIIARLVILMVWEHDVYRALAENSHDLSAALFPKRGTIFFSDSRGHETYPVAMSQESYLLYADTRSILDEAAASSTARTLAGLFGYLPDREAAVFTQLNKRTDPYEPIEQEINAEMMEKIRALALPGLAFAPRPDRYYPEGSLGASVVGFVGKNEAGEPIGRYGIEGYFEKELAGSGGFIVGAKGRDGGIISMPGFSLNPAVPGADIVLKIDRSLEKYACDKLRRAMSEFAAVSAALIMMDPQTGAIRAMCSFPDFDPNTYNKVEDVNV